MTRLHIHGGGLGTQITVLQGSKILVVALGPIQLDRNGVIAEKDMEYQTILLKAGTTVYVPLFYSPVSQT